MEKLKMIMNQSTIRYFDHTKLNTFYRKPYSALTSFAIDDALALSVGSRQSPPIIRLWAHPKTVVLGIPDARLPYIDEGIRYLRSNGFQVVIRNSGGLAVALDEGVLNVSLILPDVKAISIHNGYDAMYQFIQSLFRDLTDEIKAYEIVGSYCPGDYDLSIDGVKFAGISQRRVKNGVAIQVYLDIEGNSHERARNIKSFYTIGRKGEQTTFTYPTVNPLKMGSLSTLLGKKLTVKNVQSCFYSTMKILDKSLVHTSLTASEQEQFHKRYEQMVKRNEKIASII
ncbi:lipoate--protein ligase family protein [Virgibacillus sp. W0181]|uniref:lipoate--protein ligase family protein n=1 Tax=Virgibacillus sp. W0181 TaxID=3391581 RepID=UPI003F44E608